MPEDGKMGHKNQSNGATPTRDSQPVNTPMVTTALSQEANDSCFEATNSSLSPPELTAVASEWDFVSIDDADLDHEGPDEYVMVMRPKQQTELNHDDAYEDAPAPSPSPDFYLEQTCNSEFVLQIEVQDGRTSKSFPEVYRAICDNFPSYIEHRKASARASACATAHTQAENLTQAIMETYNKKRDRTKAVMALGAEELLGIFKRLLARRDMTQAKVKAIRRSRDVVMSYKHLGFILNRPDKPLYMRWIRDVGEAILRHQEYVHRIQAYGIYQLEEPEVFKAHSMALWSKQWALILGQRDLAAEISSYHHC